MTIKLTQFLTASLLALSLGACLSPKNLSSSLNHLASGDSAKPAIITGNLMMGPVANAKVRAYPFNEDGTVDLNSELASANTDENGEYRLLIQDPKGNPIAIQVSGGSYQEEASGTTVELKNRVYTSLIEKVEGGKNINAALGPIPDLSYKRMKSKISNGGIGNIYQEKIGLLIHDLNTTTAKTFGLGDVVNTLPADTRKPIPPNGSGQYALVMVAISHQAHTEGKHSDEWMESLDPFSGSALPKVGQLQSAVNGIGNGDIEIEGVDLHEDLSPPEFSNPALALCSAVSPNIGRIFTPALLPVNKEFCANDINVKASNICSASGTEGATFNVTWGDVVLATYTCSIRDVAACAPGSEGCGTWADPAYYTPPGVSCTSGTPGDGGCGGGFPLTGGDGK